MRGEKASRKEQENKFRHHDFHGSEIVRIYCIVQSIAITFRGLGWAGSFSSSERQCFEEGKTWETENDEYYPSAMCLSWIISKKLFRCCNRTSLASLLPKLQIKARKNNFHLSPLSSMSQSFKHSTFMWTSWNIRCKSIQSWKTRSVNWTFQWKTSLASPPTQLTQCSDSTTPSPSYWNQRMNKFKLWNAFAISSI